MHIVAMILFKQKQNITHFVRTLVSDMLAKAQAGALMQI